jgi:hypothetical protein
MVRIREADGRSLRNVPLHAPGFWANHPEGSFIAVVYSKSRPSISGIKYQVEQKRKALAKRGR